MDQKSTAMWCITRTSTCSAGPRLSSVSRKTGPISRSNGWLDSPAQPVVEFVFIRPEVVPGHPHPPVWVHQLDRMAVPHTVSGAQHGIGIDERLRGLLQRGDVQVTADQDPRR